jgi:hypothetical protein
MIVEEWCSAKEWQRMSATFVWKNTCRQALTHLWINLLLAARPTLQVVSNSFPLSHMFVIPFTSSCTKMQVGYSMGTLPILSAILELETLIESIVQLCTSYYIMGYQVETGYGCSWHSSTNCIITSFINRASNRWCTWWVLVHSGRWIVKHNKYCSSVYTMGLFCSMLEFVECDRVRHHSVK